MFKKNLINYDEKIFIAGGNGMVGSAIKRALIRANYGNKELGGRIYCPTRQELDLLNFKEVEEWFKKFKPSIVIIAAAKVGGILANSTKPYDFIIENLKIQTNLIEVSWLRGIKRLLFLGSSCIYPKLAPQPIKEEYLMSGSLEKTNQFYAVAKISGLKLCESLFIQHKFDSISLMPTNLYGEGDNYHATNSHVLPALIRKFHEAKIKKKRTVTCWGTGKPLREFLYVDDLAEAVIFVLEKWDPLNNKNSKYGLDNCINLLNVGSNFEISIKDLTLKIAKIIDFKGEIEWDQSKPDGTPRKKLDTEKINKLGWEAKISLDEGIKKTLFFYQRDLKNNNLRE